MEFNSEMTMMTINGHDVANVERLIRKIGYVNSRLYPTPGHRALTLTTQVTYVQLFVVIAVFSQA